MNHHVNITDTEHNYHTSWCTAHLDSLVGSKNFLHSETVLDCDFTDPLEELTEIARSLKLKMHTVQSESADSTDGSTVGRLIFQDDDGNVVFARSGNNSYTDVVSYAKSLDKARKMLQEFVVKIPRKQPSEDEAIVPFAFWHCGTNGAVLNIRDLACPSWKEIRSNYPLKVQESFEHLLSLERPEEVGKILLWHGPPGNGKTYLARALAREWYLNRGATVELVLDYHRLFGQADYMYSILLDEAAGSRVLSRGRKRARGINVVIDAACSEPSVPKKKKPDSPLRLIIVEDSASLFSTGARNREGFSSFLNVSDGIVGQGLRTVFLMTANEEIGNDIDAAVYRTGRCLQEVHFDDFSAEQAKTWLADRGCEADYTGFEGVSLAKLYSMLGERTDIRAKQKAFGF